MKLLPSDPDIQTIVRRIREDELDLQPDFQRGEVWSESKKRLLIDTILRNWHIPPIHVIERPDSHKQEVLDGQQRLAAIRDFVDGIIRVDGTVEPYASDIAEANNCTYETLPPNLRRRFDRFTLRVFSLIDFDPAEPGELFFRLNQPVSLTAAEQRNAFFGPIRRQVRNLCERFPDLNLSERFIGFSNSRMAYDDTVAKLCLSLERESIAEKITATTITERYRQSIPFSPNVIECAEAVLSQLGKCNTLDHPVVRFNKATLLSWLYFIARLLLRKASTKALDYIPVFLWDFETERMNVAHRRADASTISKERYFSQVLIYLFTDRASLRVADVSSVLLRDGILAYCFASFLLKSNPGLIDNEKQLLELHSTWSGFITDTSVHESELLPALDRLGWGRLR
jgi:hypothetical protein